LTFVAATVALVSLGAWAYPKLRKEEQGYPTEAIIEAALLPWIYDGICAAYRLSELGVDEAHRRMAGADKKAIADSIYAMLPDEVGGFDITFIKRIVTKERFGELVQNTYDRFDTFFVEKRGHFDRLFDEWKEENAPGV
jgi:hypothetical protein